MTPAKAKQKSPHSLMRSPKEAAFFGAISSSQGYDQANVIASSVMGSQRASLVVVYYILTMTDLHFADSKEKHVPEDLHLVHRWLLQPTLPTEMYIMWWD
jgi:hypothetical protein